MSFQTRGDLSRGRIRKPSKCRRQPMIGYILVILTFFVLAISFKIQTIREVNFGSGKVLVPVAQNGRKCMRLDAIQVKIYGTNNAFTTLRPYDVVLYKMDTKIDNKETALGLYLGGPEEEMRLLCCEEDGGIKFMIDEN